MLRFEVLPFLLAVPLGAVLLIALVLRSRSDLSRGRLAASLVVRTLILALLLGAMARPSWTERAPANVTTVWLLDESGSMSKAARAEAASRVSGTVVPFGDATSTDFAEALLRAEALAIPNARYVFVTDGRDPLGTAPHRADVRYEIVPSKSRDLAVTAVRAPLAIRTGEPFDLAVDFSSTHGFEIEAFVMVDDDEVKREKIRVPAGRSTATIRNLQPVLPNGPHKIVVLARADGDEEPRNNIAGAPVIALGRPRVLILEESGSGEPVAKMLQAHEFDVRRVPAARLADEPLPEYAAVVSAGLRAGAFDAKAVERLREYVADGGGFWLVPPADPAAAAEFARAPVSEILPVEFDATATAKGPGPEKKKPKKTSGTGKTKPVASSKIALLLLVDKSGSMAGDKLEIVKEACRLTADTLTAGDSIAVLAFSGKPEWVLDFTSPDRKEFVKDRIYRLLADGGTDIYPALVEAHRAMLTDPRARASGIKHVILFSDGDTRPGDIQSEVKRMVENGITVSTVCILIQDFDLFLMKEIADLGKGRFKYTSTFSKVPQIFTDEAKALVEHHRPEKTDEGTQTPSPDTEGPSEEPEKETSIQPVVLEDHEIFWADMPRALPRLTGALGGKLREGARAPIGTSERAPILAIARHGLGRVAVWTSDLEGRWSADWLKWEWASKLVAHLVRHLSSAAQSLDLAERMSVSIDPEAATIRVAAASGDERLALVVVEPRRIEIPLEPSTDGSLLGRVPLVDEAIRVQLSREASGKAETIALRIPRPYEAEFLPTEPLAAGPADDVRAPEETRSVPLALWLILAAVFLLPLDVALRRIR